MLNIFVSNSDDNNSQSFCFVLPDSSGNLVRRECYSRRSSSNRIKRDSALDYYEKANFEGKWAGIVKVVRR